MVSSISNLHRVELHVHLDGCMRPSTLFELARERGLTLPVDSSTQLEQRLQRRTPASLSEFLSDFPLALSCVAGKPDWLRRVAVEFVEDCAENDICYVETRYCPQLFAGDSLTAETALECILDGLSIGSCRTGVKVKSILCLLRQMPEYYSDTLWLAQSYQPHGVVGIDVADSEQLIETEDDSKGVEEDNGEDNDDDPALTKTFLSAKLSGLGRTVHAGEIGDAGSVLRTLRRLSPERIGHGYSAVLNDDAYAELLNSGVHIEICPTSSVLTSAVESNWRRHPVLKLAKDGANYSISTDDPTFTGSWLTEEYLTCRLKIGLPASELVRTNYCAADASFLPNEEKELLIEQLDQYYLKRL